MKRELNKLSSGNRVLANSWALGLMLATFCFSAPSAQQTNSVSSPEFSDFQIIAERNIFNPNRYARSARNQERREVRVDAFSLVGTMAYQKGAFAFFSGTSSSYQKALSLDETIAGFTVIDISHDAVMLQRDDQSLTLEVGAQMRREEEGEWRLAGRAVSTSGVTTTASAQTSNEVPDVGSGEMNDVLKKLMEQRAKEEN